MARGTRPVALQIIIEQKGYGSQVRVRLEKWGCGRGIRLGRPEDSFRLFKSCAEQHLRAFIGQIRSIPTDF